MKKNPFIISIVFGTLMIITGIILMGFNPLPQNNLPIGFKSVVLAFEFIKTNKEVAHFFKIENLEEFLYKFMMVNRIDYAFMAFYSIFLASFSFTLYKITKINVLLLAVFLALLAWPSDLLENFQIAKIANNIYGNNDNALDLLNIFTWIKWGAICGTLLIISTFFFKKTFFSILTASSCLLSFIFGCISFMHRSLANELMGLFVMLSFLLLYVCAWGYKKLL